MAKAGRPGILYDDFVAAWEKLLAQGRASLNAAIEQVGGNKATIIAFRERYEREQASKRLDILKGIELPKAVIAAIADIKTKELETITATNQALQSRLDECLKTIAGLEKELGQCQEQKRAAGQAFGDERLAFEKAISVEQARVKDLQQREAQLIEKVEALQKQYGLAEQQAAVAKKEIEMLRERQGVQ